MTKFRMAVQCPKCDTLIVDNGYQVDFTTPNADIPIVTLDLFAMQEFECCLCGTKVYTGDADSMYEYEECEDEAEENCDEECCDEEEYEED